MTLRPPPRDPAELTDFPERAIAETYPYARIHDVAQEAEWFCSCGVHRFDPPAGGDTPFGTCYLAGHPVGAFVEKFGSLGIVTRERVDAHRLAHLQVPATRLADVTDRTGLALGSTRPSTTLAAIFTRSPSSASRVCTRMRLSALGRSRSATIWSTMYGIVLASKFYRPPRCSARLHMPWKPTSTVGSTGTLKTTAPSIPRSRSQFTTPYGLSSSMRTTASSWRRNLQDAFSGSQDPR